MIKPALDIREGSILGVPANRIEFRCVHGRTSLVFVPGRGPQGYAVAVEWLTARHERRHGCLCPTSIGPWSSTSRGCAATAGHPSLQS